MSHLPILLLIAAAGLGLVVLGLTIGVRNGLRIRLRRGGKSAQTRSKQA